MLMKQSLFTRLWRHPGISFTAILLFGLTLVPVYKLSAVVWLYTAADPVQNADWNVDRVLTVGVVEDQIDAALSRGEVDTAEAFITLATEHNVLTPAAFIAKVR